MATMHIAKPDDKSTLIEWIGDDWRFGISLEQDDSESGWYLISKEGPFESGTLSKEILACFSAKQPAKGE